MVRTRSTAIAAALVSVAPSAGCGGELPAEVPDAAPNDGSLTGEGAATVSSIEVDASAALVTDGGTSTCPAISSFSVLPTALLGPGGVAELTIGTVGPPASVQWTASPPSGGTFSNTTLPQTMFFCAGPGLVTIEVQVQLDGSDAGDACAGTFYAAYTAMIGCES